MSKRDQWTYIQREHPDIAQVILEVTEVFGRLGGVPVIGEGE